MFSPPALISKFQAASDADFQCAYSLLFAKGMNTYFFLRKISNFHLLALLYFLFWLFLVHFQWSQNVSQPGFSFNLGNLQLSFGLLKNHHFSFQRRTKSSEKFFDSLGKGDAGSGGGDREWRERKKCVSCPHC